MHTYIIMYIFLHLYVYTRICTYFPTSSIEINIAAFDHVSPIGVTHTYVVRGHQAALSSVDITYFQYSAYMPQKEPQKLSKDLCMFEYR